MNIVDKKSLKRTKLHIIKCVVCNKDFGSYRNYRKTCSLLCKNRLNGIQKTKGCWRKCKKCKNKFWHKPSEDRRGSIHEYCSMSCYMPKYKTGKAISYDGYYIIGGIKVHRLIMEKHIKRKLLSSEIVHHINFNKLDNRIENLKIVTRIEHNKIHRIGNK